jgi:hypothetical protein
VVGLELGLDPVVDALPGYAAHPGDIGGRTSVVELQDGERTPQETSIQGFDELTPEVLPLPRSQVKLAPVLLLGH